MGKHITLVIGQIWKDNDPRAKGKRRLEIVGFTGASVRARNPVTGKVTKIARARFGLTGTKGYAFAAKRRAGKPKGPQLNLITVTFKAEKTLHRRLMQSAKRHARSKSFPEGNLSAWLRHTGVHYRMKKGEKVNLDAA